MMRDRGRVGFEPAAPDRAAGVEASQVAALTPLVRPCLRLGGQQLRLGISSLLPAPLNIIKFSLYGAAFNAILSMPSTRFPIAGYSP